MLLQSGYEFLEKRWRNILAAFLIYEIPFLAGNALDSNAINFLGFAVFFLLIIILAPRAFVLPNRTALLMTVLPIFAITIALLSNLSSSTSAAVLKNYSFYCLFIIFASFLPYPVAWSRHARLFAVVTLLPIGLSLLVGKQELVEGEMRLTGVLKNANNVALCSLLLLWTVRSDTSAAMRILVFATVLGCIFITSTLGALLALLIAYGLFRYGFRLVGLVALPSMAIGAFLLLGFPRESIDFLEHAPGGHKLAVQYELLWDHYLDIFGTPDYGELKLKYGAEALSGFWRLVHWINLLVQIGRDGITALAFGHGLGTSQTLLKDMPHNDYLRLLFEQGVLGLSAFIVFFCSGVFTRVLPEHRYLVLTFLLYCFIENVADNFFFMSLFSAMIAASAAARPGTTTPPVISR